MDSFFNDYTNESDHRYGRQNFVLYGLAILGFFVAILGLILFVFLVSQLTGQRVRVTKNDVVIGYIKWFRYVPVEPMSKIRAEVEQAGRPYQN